MTLWQLIRKAERLIDEDEDNSDLVVTTNQYNSGYGGNIEADSLEIEETDDSTAGYKGRCVVID
jgi:hypothetical protein